MLKERKQHGRKKMKERKHTVIRKGQKNSTNEHITLILELTREIRLWWNVQHEGKRFSVARISRIGVSSRNKKFCTARQQTNREFVNGLNSHYDPHRNFFRQRINDLQRGRCIARATDDPAAHHTNINGDQWKSRDLLKRPRRVLCVPTVIHHKLFS